MQVSVSESGTGGGFEKFCAGETDISDASRPIEEEEIAVREGRRRVHRAPGRHRRPHRRRPPRPGRRLPDHDQLIELWEPGSKVTNWNQLDPSFPDQKIALFGPGTDSGTYDYMAADVIGDESETTRDDYEASEDDNVLVQGVAGTEGATGYFGYTYYEENADKLKALAIDDGNGCVEPSAETAQAGEYTPLSRPLFIYVEERLQRQRGREGVRRLLHREPRRHRRGRQVHPAQRRPVHRDPVCTLRHRRLRSQPDHMSCKLHRAQRARPAGRACPAASI